MNDLETETFKGSAWLVSPHRQALSSMSLNSPQARLGTPTTRRQRMANKMQFSKASTLHLTGKADAQPILQQPEQSQQPQRLAPPRKPTIPQKLPIQSSPGSTQRKHAMPPAELFRIQQKVSSDGDDLSCQVVGYEVYDVAGNTKRTPKRERAATVFVPSPRSPLSTEKGTPRKRSNTCLTPDAMLSDSLTDSPPSPIIRLKPSPQKHIRFVPSPLKAPSYSRAV